MPPCHAEHVPLLMPLMHKWPPLLKLYSSTVCRSTAANLL
jgi:hypothetical protein